MSLYHILAAEKLRAYHDRVSELDVIQVRNEWATQSHCDFHVKGSSRFSALQCLAANNCCHNIYWLWCSCSATRGCWPHWHAQQIMNALWAKTTEHSKIGIALWSILGSPHNGTNLSSNYCSNSIVYRLHALLFMNVIIACASLLWQH